MNRFVVVSAAVFLLISIAYLPLLNELYWSTLTSLTPPVRIVVDLLVRNGTIFTSDTSFPFADSMAIRNGRILKVGSISTLKDFMGDGTMEVNLEGKVVVPGLNDSHVNLLSGGLQMDQIGLRGVSQKDDFCKMVKDEVQSNFVHLIVILDGWSYGFGGVTSLTEDPIGGTIMRLPSGGDKANDMILDMYESVAATNGDRDRRFRIDHAQHLATGSADRFGQHHIVASVQPDHLLDDADTAPKKLGFDRAQKESYLFQSLLNVNALVAFGSDWPVADINPLHSIRTAVKRIPPKWNHAWIPSECISFNDALTSHTISAARAAFLDHHLGSLSEGKLADFVILSTKSWDEFSKDGSASVLATYVGGKQVHP